VLQLVDGWKSLSGWGAIHVFYNYFPEFSFAAGIKVVG